MGVSPSCSIEGEGGATSRVATGRLPKPNQQWAGAAVSGRFCIGLCEMGVRE